MPQAIRNASKEIQLYQKPKDGFIMTAELEIITPNLRGAGARIDNQLQVLFKPTNQRRSAADNAWLQVRNKSSNDHADTAPVFSQ